MAVNKNFVVKNGIEVATDLIFASSALDKVGIGSTIPTKLLEVGGDSKLTGNTTLVGFATVQDTFEVGTGGTVLTVDVQAGRIGLNTATAHHNVHISNVGSGSTTLLVDGGDLKVDGNIFGGDLVSAPRLNITGIATFGDGTGADKVDINADVDMDANLHLTGVATVTGLIDANGGINVTTAKVEDLTDNRVIISGTGGELEDDANLTFDGTGLVIGGSNHLSVAGIATVTGLLDANGGLTANTAKVEDLTDNRVVIAGTGGELEDDANLTFDGTKFNVGSAVSIYASSGIVSATSFYGDGSQLTNITATSGGTLGFSTAGAIGYGVTFLKFVGAGVSTLSSPHSGIATLTIVGGGGGGSANIGVGTTVGDAFSGILTSGNLWYNTNLARLFIYYFDGSSNQWVDAAPFNIGIITASLGSLAQATALSPSLAFSGDSATGLFSPATGKQTFVSVGASILNVNPGGVDVTGVATATGLDINGDARITGILTIGSSSVTINGSTNRIQVGSGITIDGSTGIISAKSLSVGGQTVSNLGVGIKTAGGTVGYGATFLDFRGAGVSTITAPFTGISTVHITGGGGGASVSISTVAPTSPGDGDLWYDSSDGNTYIYYDSQSVWVVSQTYGY
jgi:hypothetical protein